jgi:hypothetical protein
MGILYALSYRRRGRVAEGNGLLNRHTLYGVSRVRIPASPPAAFGWPPVPDDTPIAPYFSDNRRVRSAGGKCARLFLNALFARHDVEADRRVAELERATIVGEKR